MRQTSRRQKKVFVVAVYSSKCEMAVFLPLRRDANTLRGGEERAGNTDAAFILSHRQHVPSLCLLLGLPEALNSLNRTWKSSERPSEQTARLNRVNRNSQTWPAALPCVCVFTVPLFDGLGPLLLPVPLDYFRNNGSHGASSGAHSLTPSPSPTCSPFKPWNSRISNCPKSKRPTQPRHAHSVFLAETGLHLKWRRWLWLSGLIKVSNMQTKDEKLIYCLLKFTFKCKTDDFPIYFWYNSYLAKCVNPKWHLLKL